MWVRSQSSHLVSLTKMYRWPSHPPTTLQWMYYSILTFVLVAMCVSGVPPQFVLMFESEITTFTMTCVKLGLKSNEDVLQVLSTTLHTGMDIYELHI